MTYSYSKFHIQSVHSAVLAFPSSSWDWLVGTRRTAWRSLQCRYACRTKNISYEGFLPICRGLCVLIALFQLHFHLTLRGGPREVTCTRSQTAHTSRSAASIVSSVSHLATWISCKLVWSSLFCFCPYQCDLATDASWGRWQCRWSLFAGSLAFSHFSGSILSPLLLAQCTASSHLAPNLIPREIPCSKLPSRQIHNTK